MSKLLYGDAAAREVSGRIAAPVADLTALKAIPADRRVDGMVALVASDRKRWYFHATSTVTGDDILVATPAAGSGRWLLQPGFQELYLPFTFATADAAVLLTVPTGARLQILEPAWKIDVSMTGGTTPAIGVSSSNKSGLTTKGDLLGGATGDLTATLVAATSLTLGTVGTQYGTLALRRKFFEPTETVRFDRLASAFTAGSGSVVLACNLTKNAGA